MHPTHSNRLPRPQNPYPPHWPSTSHTDYYPSVGSHDDHYPSTSTSHQSGAHACDGTTSATYHQLEMQPESTESLSPWQQTQLENEKLFYETFPDARRAAENAGPWQYHSSQGCFPGTTFSYVPSAPDYCVYDSSMVQDDESASEPFQGTMLSYLYPMDVSNISPTSSAWTVGENSTRHYGTQANIHHAPYSSPDLLVQLIPPPASVEVATAPAPETIQIVPATMVVPSQQHLIDQHSAPHRHDEEPIMDSLISPTRLSPPVVPGPVSGEPSYPDTPSSYGSPAYEGIPSDTRHPSMRFSDPPPSGHWPGYETAPPYPSDMHDLVFIKSESPEPVRQPTRRGPNRRSLPCHQGSSQQNGWSPQRSPSPRAGMRISPLPSSRRPSQAPDKKPPLACLFCRGRKIACGPPLPGSKDKTCNQCQRRSLKCEYPLESRRGMRKKKDVADNITEDGPKVVFTKPKH